MRFTRGPIMEIPEIPENLIVEAAEHAAKDTRVSKYLVMKDKKAIKTFVGKLGELLAISKFPGAVLPATLDEAYNFDFVVNGKKIEVKTTQTKVIPLGHHDAKQWTYNDQQYDYIIFMRLKTIENRPDRVFFVGWVGKEEFYEKAKHWRAGEYDPSNRETLRADSFNMLLKDLNPMISLYKLLYPERAHLFDSYVASR